MSLQNSSWSIAIWNVFLHKFTDNLSLYLESIINSQIVFILIGKVLIGMAVLTQIICFSYFILKFELNIVLKDLF